MNNEEIMEIESSQRQWNEELLHREKMNMVVEAEDHNLFALLKPKIYMDGNQWCIHWGEEGNPMEAIQGFGDTPYLAILDFNKSFYSKIKWNSKQEQL